MEAAVPGAFNPYPWIEWSDFASWGEVARWAEANALEIVKNRVDAAAVAAFVADVAKAQALPGDSLSTAHAGAGAWWKGGGALAGVAALLALAAWARARRRARNAPDARLVPQPAPTRALAPEAVEPQRLAA